MRRQVQVRTGAYADSVALMLATRELESRAGVRRALLAMATPLNLDQLATAGFEAPPEATPDDLLVAVEAVDDDELAAALGTVDGLLRGSHGTARDGMAPPPRTVGAAARRPGARQPGVALISVPGEHAFVEALDALDAGLHPLVFSDHVALEQEVLLKDRAAERGMLVMGPDCGTVILDGLGLAFANVVRPGPVSLVAASGTGAQQVCCLLDDAGVGVRHVLGVGGRDLTAAVAGRSTLAALQLLDADPATEVVGIVAKPPDRAVATRIREAAAAMGKPVVVGFVGEADLTAIAGQVAARLGGELPPPRRWPAPALQAPRRGHLRGLFAGGTLCAEATMIAAAALGRVAPEPVVDGHCAVDLGDDRHTAGRPHPLIDQSLRIEHLEREAHRHGSHVLLLDVVLGHAAHRDPAAELAPAIHRARGIAAARGEDLAVVVVLCGTAGDPQDRARQALALQEAGAAVYASNADATRAAVALLEAGG